MCKCKDNKEFLKMWAESLEKQKKFEENARKGIFPKEYSVLKLIEETFKPLG